MFQYRLAVTYTQPIRVVSTDFLKQYLIIFIDIPLFTIFSVVTVFIKSR